MPQKWGTRLPATFAAIQNEGADEFWIAEYNWNFVDGFAMVEREKDRTRVDARGRAYAGSQRQIQTYVNEFPDQLNRAIVESVGGSFPSSVRIEWVSPLKGAGYTEFRDKDFLGALGLQQHMDKLLAFWPKGGPCWDALARVAFDDGSQGCILVEAKSHVNEIYGNGCRAKGTSLERISGALLKTKEWLGVVPEARWIGDLYQSANRYAHLYFLRQIAGIDAYLVNMYFTGDIYRPTSLKEWTRAIYHVKQQLGLTAPVPFSGDVFLNGLH